MEQFIASSFTASDIAGIPMASYGSHDQNLITNTTTCQAEFEFCRFGDLPTDSMCDRSRRLGEYVTYLFVMVTTITLTILSVYSIIPIEMLKQDTIANA